MIWKNLSNQKPRMSKNIKSAEKKESSKKMRSAKKSYTLYITIYSPTIELLPFLFLILEYLYLLKCTFHLPKVHRALCIFTFQKLFNVSSLRFKKIS